MDVKFSIGEENGFPEFYAVVGDLEFVAKPFPSETGIAPYKASHGNKSATVEKIGGLFIVKIFVSVDGESVLMDGKDFNETEAIQAFAHAHKCLIEIQLADVWGVFDLNEMKMKYKGMIVARGLGKTNKYFTQEQKDKALAEIPEVCPIWGDTLPLKSVTVICNADQESIVTHWLHHVHGAYCVSSRLELKDGRIAMRSDYMCE